MNSEEFKQLPPEHNDNCHCNHGARAPPQHIVKVSIFLILHEQAIIDEQEDEDQNNRQQHPVQNLYPQEHLNQRHIRNQCDGCADDN